VTQSPDVGLGGVGREGAGVVGEEIDVAEQD
jgi:hypothetical protein